jgi:hypothetical protein
MYQFLKFKYTLFNTFLKKFVSRLFGQDVALTVFQ